LDTGQIHERRWLIVTVMALCMFVAVMDNTIMTVALASIQKELGAGNSELQWSMDAYTLTFAALLFTAGLLGDRYGRRKVLIAGLLLFAGASAFGAWSADSTQLILWRGAMGVGAAVIPGCTMAVITTVCPAAERPKAIALWSAAVGIGIAAGPIIGGLLVGTFWWGSALMINIPFAVLSIVLVALLVPENRAPAAARLDVVGVLLSITGIGTLVFGIIELGDKASLAEPSVFAPLLGGLALLALLIVVERRSNHPAVDLALFRNRLFSAGSLTLAAVFFAAMGASFILVFYVQLLRGFTPLQSGLLMLPLAVGSMIAAARGQMLVARIGGARTVALGALLLSAGLGYYAMTGAEAHMWLFETVQGVCGIGFGLAFAPTMAIAVSMVPQDKAGAGTALANTLRHMGTALGIAVLGAVLGAAYSDRIAEASQVLPAQIRAEATDSLGSTAGALHHVHAQVTQLQEQVQAGVPGAQEKLTALRPLDAAAPQLLQTAQEAFLDAMHLAMGVAAGVGIVAALIALAWLPGKPGRTAAAQDAGLGRRQTTPAG